MLTSWTSRFLTTKSAGDILLYGFSARILLLIYCIYHDSFIDHIKYTDIDYHVFTNGSKAIIEGRSPYDDTEYRYPPIVALFFLPNVLFNQHLGKLILILSDMLCGQLVYLLSIHQGTYRQQSKIALFLWLFNPITLAISTRGSLEPIQSLILLTLIYLLVEQYHFFAGILFGFSIHIRLYPIIYSLALYGYMVQRRPHMITQSRLKYWIKTLSPKTGQIVFFSSTIATFILTCLTSYHYFGLDYLEQSFFYHLKRKDLQHNFSIYFYLFRLFPHHQEIIGKSAPVLQMIGILALSITYSATDANAKIRLRRLNFTLFSTTFLFVSLNKVCTSQYFSWYLIYVPLIIDSVNIDVKQAVTIIATWLLAQANWLMLAYLYEYRGYNVIDYVGNSSAMFLVSNMWILRTLCRNFDVVKPKKT